MNSCFGVQCCENDQQSHELLLHAPSTICCFGRLIIYFWQNNSFLKHLFIFNRWKLTHCSANFIVLSSDSSLSRFYFTYQQRWVFVLKFVCQEIWFTFRGFTHNPANILPPSLVQPFVLTQWISNFRILRTKKRCHVIDNVYPGCRRAPSRSALYRSWRRLMAEQARPWT